MADEIKNVFISHLHEDDAGLADLEKLVEKGRLTVRDASINSSNPNDAKRAGLHKVANPGPTDPVGKHASRVPHSPNQRVNWEIEYAAKEGKRIVGCGYHRGRNIYQFGTHR